MIPFADFQYFAVLLYLAVPVLAFRLVNKGARTVLIGATLLMLVVQYFPFLQINPGTYVREIWILAGYALLQYVVLVIFVRLRRSGPRRGPYLLALTFSLLPLIVAKFLPRIAPGYELGFLGISYVTFRGLDAVFGIQDGLIQSVPLFEMFAYLFFFPAISSGPIDRYRRFDTDWKARLNQRGFLRDLDLAIHKLFTGFFYKFILAYLIATKWKNVAETHTGFWGLLDYMYAYSFYLFFDFAGYSQFAIGLSYLFGVATPENFDKPFLAFNILDFWKRWHMTLSFWFRDHVYMRFVLAATKGKWFTGRYTASYLGLLLNFGLMGLWHGTAAHYLLYGLYHAALCIGYDLFRRFNKLKQIWGTGMLWKLISIFITFHFVCFGFLLFSGRLGTGPAPLASLVPGNIPGTYEGTLDVADSTGLQGWAWDEDQPDTPLRIDIYEGDNIIATGIADEYRSDLKDVGKGNGVHAFKIPLPDVLKDGTPHSVVAKISGTDFSLVNSPRKVIYIEEMKSNLVPEKSVVGPTPKSDPGTLDKVDADSIHGWAWDPAHPNESLQVEIFADGKSLLTATADNQRDDLALAGKGNGRHGFDIPTPDSLIDGNAHVISVKIKGSGIDLHGSPTTVTIAKTK
jgi:membrane protein involved in D-alanine export